MNEITIRDVRTILTAPEGINLVVVKIETSEPGLHGLGCATFTQRHLAVTCAVDDYLRPFLVGKDPRRIEDIWHPRWSGYWRNDPVLNNALSGVDMALWDIQGNSRACRSTSFSEASAAVRPSPARRPRAAGGRGPRRRAHGAGLSTCPRQMGGYGGHGRRCTPPALPGAYYDPLTTRASVPRLFEHLRAVWAVNSARRVRRLTPIDAVRLAKRWNRTTSTSSRTHSRRSRSWFRMIARRAPRRWPWASCSTTPANGCR